jgi:hypothetical protein
MGYRVSGNSTQVVSRATSDPALFIHQIYNDVRHFLTRAIIDSNLQVSDLSIQGVTRGAHFGQYCTTILTLQQWTLSI